MLLVAGTDYFAAIIEVVMKHFHYINVNSMQMNVLLLKSNVPGVETRMKIKDRLLWNMKRNVLQR
jgi:hypothetical protein